MSWSQIGAGVRAWGKTGARMHASMLWAFVHEIAIGDAILMPDTTASQQGVGRLGVASLQLAGSYEAAAAQMGDERQPTNSSVGDHTWAKLIG